MASSPQPGLEFLAGGRVGGLARGSAGGRDLMVLLGDQPLVSAETLSRLVEARAGSLRAAAVGIARAGGVGPPVLLHRSLRPQLRELQGDQGARRLLVHYAASVIGVPCRPEETLHVDTPARLEQARLIVAHWATGGR